MQQFMMCSHHAVSYFSFSCPNEAGCLGSGCVFRSHRAKSLLTPTRRGRGSTLSVNPSRDGRSGGLRAGTARALPFKPMMKKRSDGDPAHFHQVTTCRLLRRHSGSPPSPRKAPCQAKLYQAVSLTLSKVHIGPPHPLRTCRGALLPTKNDALPQKGPWHHEKRRRLTTSPARARIYLGCLRLGVGSDLSQNGCGFSLCLSYQKSRDTIA